MESIPRAKNRKEVSLIPSSRFLIIKTQLVFSETQKNENKSEKLQLIRLLLKFLLLIKQKQFKIFKLRAKKLF